MTSQVHAPVILPSGKEPPYLSSRNPGGPHLLYGRRQENDQFFLPAVEPPVFSPVACHFTDCDTAAGGLDGRLEYNIKRMLLTELEVGDI